MATTTTTRARAVGTTMTTSRAPRRRARARGRARAVKEEKFRVRDEETALGRDARVGILGGGQLGRMLGIAASPMGVRLKALDPTENCPASVSSTQVVGSFRDKEAVKAFARECDVLTVEIEHIDVEALRELAAEGVDVQPTPETLATIQDKYAQKVHFSQAGVPLGPFADCPDEAALQKAASEFGFPLMLKSKRLAYDGRGNAVAKTAADLNDAVVKLGGFEQGLYCEKWVPFAKELAVMVVRARDGETRAYPVVETVHEDNICDITTTPAPVPNKVAEAVQEAAKKAIGSFTGAGIFGVELFLLHDGSILLNECAPRPHNSGHYTIEGCACSQYENHLRAILGWPLGDTSLKVGGAVMKNILGDAEGDEAMSRAHRLMGAALEVPGASIHWYEKPDMKAARKMGHITVVGPSAAVATERLDTILRAAKGDHTPAKPAPQVGIIMGSDSDLPTMSAAAEVLESFGIGCEVTVISAHRTPDRMNDYAKSAHTRGIRAIIAGAGGAAHLPGMVAAMTPLPVIGVPVPLKYLDGMDSLLSIVQMPKGVPVATVAIGNSANAGLIAARIVSAYEPTVLSKMLAYQEDMENVVLNKASKLEDLGYRAYLDQM
ncbi:Rudiment single hybrid motif [Ostreococcus tauri]|uniref:phosphoribosylaminoimidazole carboxylase n=2 Tax=Ostreococcus tauri TaxID=70448 RepID=A0A090M3Z9_OSTTA|nr:Rudiment single hybrid motif [Ostreococcus tauri]CEF98955.1 Rudiment single hybrid motif [Ostreococcus tauri]|eukprot:XP_022839565.1 Rudiment single hybrid motif [Ostreococcus tauri]